MHNRPHFHGRSVVESKPVLPMLAVCVYGTEIIVFLVPRSSGEHQQQHADWRHQRGERRGQQGQEPADERVGHRSRHGSKQAMTWQCFCGIA